MEGSIVQLIVNSFITQEKIMEGSLEKKLKTSITLIKIQRKKTIQITDQN